MPGSGGWYGLLAIGREARDEARAQATAKPIACPRCGEPLRPGPRGNDVFCLFDGWQPGMGEGD